MWELFIGRQGRLMQDLRPPTTERESPGTTLGCATVAAMSWELRRLAQAGGLTAEAWLLMYQNLGALCSLAEESK